MAHVGEGVFKEEPRGPDSSFWNSEEDYVFPARPYFLLVISKV